MFTQLVDYREQFAERHQRVGEKAYLFILAVFLMIQFLSGSLWFTHFHQQAMWGIFYDVEKIIRIGSAGALQDDVSVMDVVIAMSACTDSNYASQYQLPGTFAPTASYELVARAVEVAKEQGTPVRVGSVVSSDAFYGDNPESSKAWRKMGVLCVEMECAALFMNAARAGKEALGILTISDHVFRDEAISAEARQTSFNRMMEIALGI